MKISIFSRRVISVLLSICLLMTTVFMVGYRETVSAANTDITVTVGNGQTWTRPEPANGPIWGTFTAIGPGSGSYYYSVYSFGVSTTGDYSITSSNATGSLTDAVLYLYSGSFNAASPVSPSFMTGNDDTATSRNPAIASVHLTAGTIYYLVTTGFSTSDNGSLSVRFHVNGSGTVSALYTVSYTAAANGTISGSTPQTVFNGGNGTQVTAVPNAGYHFTNWSNGALAATRSETNVTSNISLTANFAINTYALSYTPGANGTITGITSQNVNHGSNGSLVTAVPNTGYHFVNWSDGSLSAARTDLNVQGPVSVTANFAINNYSLAYAVYAAGTNGTLSGITLQSVNYGQNGTTVVAIPNTGYHFAGWSDGVLTAARTDTNVTANISVTADFAINTYTLGYTAGLNGTISGNASQSVNYGNNGTAVTAVPDTGYHFVDWSDGVLTAERTDTNVSANLSVTANFAINNYALTYTSGLNGTVTGITSQSVDYGSDGTAVTAVADTGYHFIGWSDSVSTETRTDLNVTDDVTVTANFAINSYTLAYAVYAAGTNGTLTGSTAQSVEFGSNGTEVTAVPNIGYHFTGWSDGVMTASRTELNVLDDLTVTADFAINSYTLTYAAAANGALSGSAAQTVDYGSDGTAVTAIPDAGYHFTSWSDGVLTAARTDTNIKEDLSVTASFAINSYTLTYAAGTNGTLTGVASQAVNYGSDGTAVTAVPATGYHFTGWSDGVLTAIRTDLSVEANLSVTANFAINSYTVIFQDWDGRVLSEQTVVYGSDAISPANPVRSGYTFTSWSLPFTGVTGNITTVAGYSQNPAPTATPTPTPATDVLGANRVTATPAATAAPTTAPATGVLGAAKTGEADNQNRIMAALILLAAFGTAGTVLVLRRKKIQD